MHVDNDLDIFTHEREIVGIFICKCSLTSKIEQRNDGLK